MTKTYKLLMLFVLLLVGKTVNAQYTVFVNEPADMFTFNQLWNFNVGYSGTTQGLDHFMEVALYEENSGLLFTVKTNTFKLYAGGVAFSLGNINYLKPFNINIVKSVPYNDLVYNGGIFPAGRYTFTYNLYKGVPGNGQVVEINTFNVNIESLGSIIQLNVADNDTIDNLNPVFNWVYSNLKITDPRATFKFKMVELTEGQSSFDAIYFNTPFLDETLLNSVTSLQYPNSARKLQKGKTYVWQVSVLSNGVITAQSDVWTFTIRDYKEKPVIPVWYFEAMPNRNSSYSILTTNLLHIKYVTKFKDKDNKLTYRILNANNKTVLDDKELPLTVSFGDNRYEIDICNYTKKIVEGLYIFEITDDLGQKWYIKFNNNTNHCN